MYRYESNVCPDCFLIEFIRNEWFFVERIPQPEDWWVYILTDNEEVKSVIKSAKDALLKDTASDDIIEGEGNGLAKNVKIDGSDVKLSLSKN